MFDLPKMKQPLWKLFYALQPQLLLLIEVLNGHFCQQLPWFLVIIQADLEIIQSERSLFGPARL